MQFPLLNNSQQTDAYFLDLLKTVKTIALVGASSKPHRASYEVMSFLQEHNFRVIPINPILAGQNLLGEKVYASIAEIPISVDMVEIFRNSEAAGSICEEVSQLTLEKQPKIIWMQIGVMNQTAAKRAQASGMTVVMDQCPKRILQKAAEL